MNQNDKALKAASPYSAVITREQFLFYEMRTTAKLIQEGLKEQEIVSRIETENLFQYPTEKMVGRLAVCCLTRLKSLNDPSLIEVIANQPSDVAKQVCLYAMMKKYNLVWDKILGLNLFGDDVPATELEWYKKQMNTYGLPLDSRRQYSKTDWQLWTGAMAGSVDGFREFLLPVYKFYNETPDRVPLGDWVNTTEPTFNAM